MGDGNFGGGGSVEWKINNKKDDVEGGPKQHKGKDNGALTEVGKKLVVTCQNARVSQAPGSGLGTVIVEVTLLKNPEQVVLKWGDDVDDNRNLTQQS